MRMMWNVDLIVEFRMEQSERREGEISEEHDREHSSR